MTQAMHYPMSDDWRIRVAAHIERLNLQREAAHDADLRRYQRAFRDAAATLGVIVTGQRGQGYTATLAPSVAEWPGDDWHYRAREAAFDVMAAERRAQAAAESGEGSEA